jgi:ferredoxin-type protein NapG
MSKDRPVNRRSFFREGLRELLRPVADTITDRLDAVAREFAKASEPFAPMQAADPRPYEPPAPSPGPWLRPPGSGLEPAFRETCSLSGQCVTACPVQAIKIDHSGAQGGGLPYINADESACILCDGLACMSACPSGALTAVAREQVAMGRAEWAQSSCLRTYGDACRLCVDRCPIGASAIGIADQRIEVLAGCVGCGVCQHECPTSPKSIVVKPREV